MAEEKAAGAPALDTNIETGGFDEKRGQAPPPTHAPKAPVAEDEEPDEDMDALIEDLESEDGHAFDEEEETQPGGGRVVPEDQLQTDSRVGLTEAEVINRRRKWGLNQMKEERENMILKFLMFFVGPIQFVMVSQPHPNISSFPCFPPVFTPFLGHDWRICTLLCPQLHCPGLSAHFEPTSSKIRRSEHILRRFCWNLILGEAGRDTRDGFVSTGF
jgi:hypothetical protein